MAARLHQSSTVVKVTRPPLSPYPFLHSHPRYAVPDANRQGQPAKAQVLALAVVTTPKASLPPCLWFEISNGRVLPRPLDDIRSMVPLMSHSVRREKSWLVVAFPSLLYFLIGRFVQKDNRFAAI